jgi:glycosyltransferase 2 family protein
MRRYVTFGVCLLISAVFLALALRNVEWNQLIASLRNVNLSLIAAALGLTLVANLIRAVRWGILLGYAPGEKLPAVFSSMMIGYLGNNVLPARLGELIRIDSLYRQVGMSRSTSGATVLVERVVDLVILIGVVGVLAAFVPLPPAIDAVGWSLVVIFVAGLATLIALACGGRQLIALFTWLANAVSTRLGHKIEGLLERFMVGVQSLRTARKVTALLLLTTLLWGTEAVVVGLVLTAMGISLGWIAPLFLLVVLSLSFAIPAAPGAVGTYEFFAVVALSAFAVSATQASAVALLLHGIVYATSTGLGVLCLWSQSLSLTAMTKQPESPTGAVSCN